MQTSECAVLNQSRFPNETLSKRESFELISENQHLSHEVNHHRSSAEYASRVRNFQGDKESDLSKAITVNFEMETEKIEKVKGQTISEVRRLPCDLDRHLLDVKTLPLNDSLLGQFSNQIFGTPPDNKKPINIANKNNEINDCEHPSINQLEGHLYRLTEPPLKRVKQNNLPDSEGENNLIKLGLSIQKNKITNYFKANHDTAKVAPQVEPPTPETKVPSNDFDTKITRVDEAHLHQYEALYKSKDLEIRRLEEKLQSCMTQNDHFKRKSQETLLSVLKESENLKRLQRKRWIASERLRVGEFIERREGSKFKEVWIDGYELQGLRRTLNQITKQKEALLAFKKGLKKKISKQGQSQEKTNSQGNTKPSHSTTKASNTLNAPQMKSVVSPSTQSHYLSLSAETSLAQITKQPFITSPNNENSDSSNSLSLNEEVNIEEVKQQIAAQLLHLSREEAYYKEKIDASEAQKRRFKIIAKHTFQEENCLFAQPECWWPILNERYQVLSFLSKSSRCETYRVFDKQELKEKTCELIDTVSFGSEGIEIIDHQSITERFKVLKQLLHPHIAQYHDCFLVGPNLSCLISDFCNGHSVSNFMLNSRTISERDARSIVSQILSALKYVAETSISINEFDICPSNIFFHNGAVKIKAVPIKQTYKLSAQSSRYDGLNSDNEKGYSPPELRNPGLGIELDKSFVWTIGMLLFEMIYGQSLTQGYIGSCLLRTETLSSGHLVELPAKPNISPESKELIKKCLAVNPEQRPSIRDLINLFTKG